MSWGYDKRPLPEEGLLDFELPLWVWGGICWRMKKGLDTVGALEEMI